MRFFSCEASPNFYGVRGITSAVRSVIQYTIKSNLRYYENNSWYIHRSQILGIAQLGYSIGVVDYSELDDELQMRIATEKRSWTRAKTTMEITPQVSREEALRTLHLQPDAPKSLIKAAWKHLASTQHPDKGGDEELFRTYSTAYEILKE